MSADFDSLPDETAPALTDKVFTGRGTGAGAERKPTWQKVRDLYKTYFDTLYAAGTVTSVATGTGLTGGPISVSGTIAVVPASQASLGGVTPGSTVISTAEGQLISNAPIYTKLAPSSGTLGLWHFDEGTGTSIRDVTDSYTATLSGNTWSSTDGGNVGSSNPVRTFASGSCLSLSGSSSYAQISGLLDTEPAAGTIEFWFSPNVDYPANSGGLDVRLFTKYNRSAASSGDGWDLSIDHTSGKLNFARVVGGTVTTIHSANTAWVAGVWYHIAASWGAAGMSIYVNGARQDFTTLSLVPPSSGSSGPFVLGAYYGGPEGGYGLQAYINASFDELQVMSRQKLPEEVCASYWRQGYTLGMSENGRWAAASRATIISPTHTNTFDRDLAIEPSGFWDGSQFVLFYTGYRLDSFASQIGRATSPDGVTWTKHGVVLGAGVGGESSNAACSNVVKSGSTYYMYYSAAFADLNYATSTDGITWTKQGTAIAGSSQGWFTHTSGGPYNTSIYIDAGSVWHMIFEAGDSPNGIYKLGYATSTDGATWSLYSGNPLTSLQIGAGNWSGPDIHGKDSNGLYHMWYHASYITPNPPAPNFITHAVSADFKNWTVVQPGSIFDLAGESFLSGNADQVADPLLIEALGRVWMFYDVDRNDGVNGTDGFVGLVSTPGAISDIETASVFTTVAIPQSVSAGEYVTSAIASGSAVSLTNATAANITSISIGPGDWDVFGNCNFSASSATVTGASGGISTTSATLPTDGTEVYSGVQVTLSSETDSVTLSPKRVSVLGSTTVYLVAKAGFSAGSVAAFGSISARRFR